MKFCQNCAIRLKLLRLDCERFFLDLGGYLSGIGIGIELLGQLKK